MNTGLNSTLFLALGLAVPAVAAAQGLPAEVPPQDDEIVVVASGQKQRLAETGQSVSIVTTAEIDAVQGADITRLLERLPGVALTRNGGLGGQTGLLVRGANADQLLVTIDGVRVADYSSPGGGYDLGNLMAGNLARMELLRGSNSVVWGSQAMAGVRALTTREVDGIEAMADYGAFDTVYTTATAGIRRDGHALSLTGGYAESDGFSAKSAGVENDPYRQWSLAGKGRLGLGESLTLVANGRYADSRLGIDLFGADDADIQDSREGSGLLGLGWETDSLTLGGGYVHSFLRRSYTGGFNATYRGQANRGEVNGQWRPGGGFELTFGADTEWNSASSTYDARRKARTSSAHALLGWRGNGLSLAAGARLDDHSRFGSEVTLGANGTVDLGGEFRLRGSVGEGFKAPTLYQLFGSYVGNPLLDPERSRSFEVGLEKGARNRGLHLAATLFRRDSRNLIDLDTSFSYRNIAKARAEGAELELGAQVSERFRVQGAYTYVKARDRTLKRDLSRRPRHAVTISADWQAPLAGLNLGADLRMAGDAVEYDWMGNAKQLDGYAVASLRASLPVNDRIELFGRVENLADVHYETAAGFSTPGRSAYFGARARF